MPRPSGWSGLFWKSFKASRNAMVLLDEDRCHVAVNAAYMELVGARRTELLGRPASERVVDGPLFSPGEWHSALRQDEFSGVAELIRADGSTVTVQWAGYPETATGKRLVLVVAMHTARTGRRLPSHDPTEEPLSEREREVVGLIGDGKSGPEIAEELRISHNTVRTHAHNAMTKVGARSRAHLVAKALGDGLIAA
jgi:PAS domain S-box-containing protein